MSDRYILGIHDGHNSTAALLKNGVLVGALSEERLTRVKNECGYPKLSVDHLLANEGIEASDISAVALSSLFMHDKGHLEHKELWYRVGAKEQELERKKNSDYGKKLFRIRKEERYQEVESHLGISRDNIHFIEHHESHAAAAYFGSHFPLEEKVLVLTCDGAGDGLSATVSVAQNGKMERIATTDRHDSLGKIYSRVTYLMGMKAWEHEYKIMGMAPFADDYGVNKSIKVFRELLGLSDDGMSFQRKTELSMNYIYFHLRDRLENHRFDWVAGAVQQFTEEMLLAWVEAVVNHTGIRKIACGGGVFMNIKANMILRQSDHVDDIYIFPSCGDESNSIGAAFVLDRQLDDAPTSGKPHQVATCFLGGESDDKEIEDAIREAGISESCVIERVEDIHTHVGKELAKGHVVARAWGRMEWGARSLGNRGILADARIPANVQRINDMIKMRDFWMPFAPSILFERAGDYLGDWSGEGAPFMIMGYESTPMAHEQIPAAMQPYDKTIRPQLVVKEENPEYWQVLKAYEAETGVGGFLNTSFNLHGYPIVNKAHESIDVLMRSGLERLALGHYYIVKKSALK